MKKLFTVFLLAITIGASLAQTPTTLSYQGLLTDASGAPVTDASYDITFSFYTVETGGSATFLKGPISVQTFKGLFTVILGNGQGNNNTSLPYTLGSQQYWIGVKNGTQAELTPRAMLTAVPYAFQAQTVVTVDAATITSGTVPDARLSTNLQDLADGSLTGSKVGSGISASNITTGTLPDARLSTNATIPVGTIVSYIGTTAPSGWLLCDGSSYPRATYPVLSTVIASSFGGSGSDFFVPDLRGRFLRGVDGIAGRDPDKASRTASNSGGQTGNNVGSLQADELKAHDHTIQLTNSAGGFGGSLLGPVGGSTGPIISTNLTIGNETRPKNVYVNFIIKY